MPAPILRLTRSEEHTSESSHLGISYAVFCLKKATCLPQKGLSRTQLRRHRVLSWRRWPSLIQASVCRVTHKPSVTRWQLFFFKFTGYSLNSTFTYRHSANS